LPGWQTLATVSNGHGKGYLCQNVESQVQKGPGALAILLYCTPSHQPCP
jgi:hypothetical protein